MAQRRNRVKKLETQDPRDNISCRNISNCMNCSCFKFCTEEGFFYFSEAAGRLLETIKELKK